MLKPAARDYRPTNELIWGILLTATITARTAAANMIHPFADFGMSTLLFRLASAGKRKPSAGISLLRRAKD